MTTPLAIVADSIIEFILSLLRDPAAVDELKKDPSGTLARNHLNDACADDVRAVAPVVFDRADVMPRSGANGGNGGNGTPRNGNDSPPVTPRDGNDGNDGVVRELLNIAHNFYIDNRSTLIDQSVNQNIWTEGGDVNQLFDQTAAVAAGDGSIAAGDDVDIDSSTDTEVDVDIDIDVEGSGDAPLDEAIDAATDVVDPAAGADEALDTVPTDAADPGVTDVLDDIEAAAESADASAPAAPPAVEPVPQVEEAVEAAEEAATYAAPAVEVDESVWDTTEPVLEDEPLYEDELLEEQ